MKKCDYCAKEISYYDQYCDENCEKKALDFYTYMISSMKIKKAVFVTRMIGVALFSIGIIILIIKIFFK